MARITREMLEQENANLREWNKQLRERVIRLEEKVEIYNAVFSRYLRGIDTLVIALERASDGVAHVITDITRGERR